MWTFIFIFSLGLNIFQVTGQDSNNSTQMYYAKLTIDESAIGNLTTILRPFVNNTNLRVDNLEKTTICHNVTGGLQCTCEPSYKWSDKVCKANQKCCGIDKCIFPQNSARMCVSNTTVTISGSITMFGVTYTNCLRDQNSEDFRDCNNNLIKEIKTVYSTLIGFDTLTITKYSIGSIIVDFEMNIAEDVTPQALISKSYLLSLRLQASLVLETRGIIHLSAPTNPVDYNSKHNLRCTTKENLNVLPVWRLKRADQVYDITNGTESVVTSTTTETEIELKHITELWEGKYTCVYLQVNQSVNISHRASAELDVCLMPNIEINIYPSFPRCLAQSTLINIGVKCRIRNSDENYTVTWGKENIDSEIKSNSPAGPDVYEANALFDCKKNSSTTTPQLLCIFENRCNQYRNASVEVNIIHVNDQFCKADGDWEDTKAGFTAVLKCKNAAGLRKRSCSLGDTHAKWENEISACVNWELNNVLEIANIVDIGIGTVNDNAAGVFSKLKNVTDNKEKINNFANLNVSVYVLFTLSQKPTLQPNDSVANDFLDSSSNLLSLNSSWKANANEGGNVSLSERFLNSVEKLIEVANITGVPEKKNIEVDTSNCSQKCTNKVFDVTIALGGSDPGSVKSAGFKELQNYLPTKDDNVIPNSIVVSTTTQKKQQSVEVDITFNLLTPRPRNVEMTCVAWDYNISDWSSHGCEWGGSSNETHCHCTHLSSFAILMSKKPLRLPAITYITYAGLSVSIISLIISLVIEMIVWKNVVKTNSLYLRHTAHVNISLCLLVADCCFLLSSEKVSLPEIWCKTFVLLKHFCYLSMFFWMLCLSCTLLHQTVFVFHSLSKKCYLRFSLVLGYVCPLLIVAITFLANGSGAEGLYYSNETCWLVYSGFMKGSIFTFVLPVGIIVFVNVFSMVVVIMKLLDHPKNTESHEKEKKAAITVIRSVILLTPIFGVTWIFGFALMLLDLTSGPMVYAVNYAFTLLNAFQGLFILLTTCLGDKLTREALLSHLKHNAPASTTDISSIKSDSTWKK